MKLLYKQKRKKKIKNGATSKSGKIGNFSVPGKPIYIKGVPDASQVAPAMGDK